MTDQYKLIDDLHEELETVHEGLGQYDGIELKNGYETGPFFPEKGASEEYGHILEDKESFEEDGCLLRAVSSLEEMASILQRVSGAEYITMGRIPIEGPLGESMVDNVHLNYNFKAHEDSVESYWELDSELVDTNKEKATENIRGIESVANQYASTDVRQLPLESENECLKGMASRAD